MAQTIERLPARGNATGTPPAKRVSAKVAAAVRLFIQEGRSRSEAAREAGLKEDSFYRALSLPHVKALIRREFAELREHGPARAYHRIDKLAAAAESEHVKLDANKWIAGVDALSPVKNVNVNAQVSHSFAGYAYEASATDAANTVDNIVEDAEIIDNE